MNETKRLNKVLADAGICSRRKADEYIFAGKVKVNGVIVDNPGTQINLNQDLVIFNGKKIEFIQEKKFSYLLLHKPIAIVSTAKDPEGRETVLDLLPQAFKAKRLYPVGRLDYFSEGLILLTDDGDLAHRLTHPSWHLPKLYEVSVRTNFSDFNLDNCLKKIKKGMTLAEGEKLAPVQVKVLEEQFSKHHNQYHFVLEMELIQGINRQIRRMCRDLDLTILKLKRIAQGPILLGNLPIGKIRELTPNEVNTLKKAVGLA